MLSRWFGFLKPKTDHEIVKMPLLPTEVIGLILNEVKSVEALAAFRSVSREYNKYCITQMPKKTLTALEFSLLHILHQLYGKTQINLLNLIGDYVFCGEPSIENQEMNLVKKLEIDIKKLCSKQTEELDSEDLFSYKINFSNLFQINFPQQLVVEDKKAFKHIVINVANLFFCHFPFKFPVCVLSTKRVGKGEDNFLAAKLRLLLRLESERPYPKSLGFEKYLLLLDKLIFELLNTMSLDELEEALLLNTIDESQLKNLYVSHPLITDSRPNKMVFTHIVRTLERINNHIQIKKEIEERSSLKLGK